MKSAVCFFPEMLFSSVWNGNIPQQSLWFFISAWALRCSVRTLRTWVFVVFLLGFLIAQDASERAALLHPGVLSDGQFYSPPESVAGSYVHTANRFFYWHIPLPSEGEAGKWWKGGDASLLLPSMNCSKANWHVNQRLFSFLKTKLESPLCTKRPRGNIKLWASDNCVLTLQITRCLLVEVWAS